MLRWHLHVEPSHIKATKGSFREMKWDMWQSRGSYGVYVIITCLRGCYGVYVLLCFAKIAFACLIREGFTWRCDRGKYILVCLRSTVVYEHAWKAIFTKWSGTWQARCSYGVCVVVTGLYVAVRGSSWQSRVYLAVTDLHVAVTGSTWQSQVYVAVMGSAWQSRVYMEVTGSTWQLRGLRNLHYLPASITLTP